MRWEDLTHGLRTELVNITRSQFEQIQKDARMEMAVEVTSAEMNEATQRLSSPNSICNTVSVFDEILRQRLRDLSRKKTPEERVTVRSMEINAGWRVDLDGQFRFGGDGISRCDAEVYRDGLVAQLRLKQAV